MKTTLPLIIFLEGFVSIATEIVTIRQLLPVAGGSVIVTSLVIGVFLLFLAFGYHAGGRIEKNLSQSLRRNFMIAACWLGIGLSYPFITLFFYFTQKLLGFHILYPLIAFLLFILAPLIYLLGQTVPITMNMVKQNRSVGLIGGDTLSLSTLGSFLGAILTALVFMNYFGVAWTLFINFICLLMLSILLTESKFFPIQILFSLFVIAIVFAINVYLESKLFLLTNNYANYRIAEVHQNFHQEKYLQINDSYSSFINEKKQAYPYIEIIKRILFQELNLRHANILVLGAGGFTLSAEDDYQNHLTYVDIDSQIKNISVPRFVSKLNGEFIADDARHFLQSTTKQYQAIVVDVYSNTRTIPAYLLTREYIHAIQARLMPGGTVIFNMVAKPTLSDPYSKRIDNTIRSVFKNCMVIPQFYSDQITNILYTCHNTVNQVERTVYTDNRNSSTTDSFDW